MKLDQLKKTNLAPKARLFAFIILSVSFIAFRIASVHQRATSPVQATSLEEAAEILDLPIELVKKLGTVPVYNPS